MRKLVEFLLLRCGYVRDVELIETQSKLRDASRMVIYLSTSVVAYRDRLTQEEQAHEETGRLLGGALSDAQMEIQVLTFERDNALHRAAA